MLLVLTNETTYNWSQILRFNVPFFNASACVEILNRKCVKVATVLDYVFCFSGVDLPGDNCPRDQVRLQERCLPLLESVPPCSPPQWVILGTPVNRPQGICGARLCGRGRVFLVSDQLCHDVREPGLCPSDRRLYVTAFGSPVCDCYEGEFPDRNGVCHPIHTQGPCPPGQIWSTGDDAPGIYCQSAPCLPLEESTAPITIPFDDNKCYKIGTRGPCPRNQILGFSISRRKAVCTTLRAAGYEEPEDEARLLDELYPRFAPPRYTANVNWVFVNRITKRQIGNVVSDPVIPDLSLNLNPTPGTILETPLLTQCRPGAATDANFKCRDIILGPNVDTTARGVHAPPVPPTPGCPSTLCYNDMAQCVSCDQAVVDTCSLSLSLNLPQNSCQAIAAGLG
ncbi:hypothetical protein SK128_008556 [Halocaridina rubra]|uniref:DUF4789 domain-containing protein n=1 Tax=Halocaridina rubra TaxID=373956 RepID=A0AAN8XIK7_HALRR